MPQLDPTWYASQMFWLIVSFFMMLFIMSKFILPQITDIMNKRQEKIDDYLGKAHENKVLAEQSLENYHKAIADATARAKEDLENMQRELDMHVAEKQDDLNRKLSKKIADGEERIQKSKEEALGQMHEISEELAWNVVQKIGIKNVVRSEVKDAVQAVMKN